MAEEHPQVESVLVAEPRYSDDAARIIVAYIESGNSPISPEALPDLIASVYNAVERHGEVASAPALAKPTPPVPVEESIGPDFLICLEDGKKLKMLKRYLRTQHGMTPEEYRVKWGLPANYPMVSRDYSTQRSSLAKQQGLGRKAEPPPLRLRKRS